ncbi:MAG TPA: bifunctional serine/threonine-protein kinase/formylglycine-generating enzyme family protein [Polyangiaceae bacterium]|nr:bifunctional serine/threonine-protein kinase/formylglycine-generating enzyme family protein [Polyangiaceae bacterium]
MTFDSLGIVGTTVGDKYVIEAVVGEGSFSLVYRAMHLVWRTPVAIKCFRGFHDVPSETRDRLLLEFVQEGALLSELSGKSATIVQARDAGTLVAARGEALPYIVLEWLEGRTLESVLEEQRAVFGERGWPIERVIEVVAPIATALGMVHRRGIAHRDIKPNNIWIGGAFDSEEMFVKLLDFGIAKVVGTLKGREFRKTKGTVTSFTPAYGAPEQFSRNLGATGPWTDVYALALVFVELLAGRSPIEGDDFIQLGMAAVDPAHRPTPRALGVPVQDALERVLRKALSVRPDDRFATASDFWDALENARERARRPTVRVGSSPSGTDAAPERPALRRLRPALATGVLSLAVGALVGGGLHLDPTGVAGRFAQGARVHLSAMGAWFSRSSQASTAPSAVVASRPPRVTCPDDMVTVAGTKFSMGNDDREPDDSELPVHEVSLSSFCIDRREVTVGSYRLCAEEGRCERAPFEVAWRGIADEDKRAFSSACNGDDPERNAHPVNCVDWNMAARYCEFAGKRLPTEAEWELAARGTDRRSFPWGNEMPDASRANACGRECGSWAQKSGLEASLLYKDDDGFALTAPVGSFPRGRSPFGAFDMAGNVAEWVGDWEGPYRAEPENDPPGPAEGTRRVVRGGAFNGSRPSWFRATRRWGDEPDTRSHAYGFRCARSLSPPKSK